MKKTQKSLLLSITAMILCCALLAGTTFAWFTDSASTGVNQIVAGNLDIVVEYKDGGEWKTIEGKDTLFSVDLWEPGHTEYVYLRVKNAGTLALKYKVLVTPVSENGGVNAAGNSFKLSDYLVFGTTPPSTTLTTYENREAARAAVGNVKGLNVNDLTRTGEIVAQGADQYLALVVYMPEEVGNDANYKTGTAAPTIELGIKVVATQKDAELDSFDNTYDKDAVNAPFYAGGAYYDYFGAVNETDTARDDGTFTVTKTDGTTGIIASASGQATAGAQVNLLVQKSSEAENNFSFTVGEGYELNGYEIKVTGQEKDSLVYGQLYVGTGLEDFKFYHNGEAMTLGTQGNLDNGEYCYNSTDGYVYFASKTFSPFQATYKAPAAAIGTAVYGTLADAIAAAQNGDVITLLKDVVAELPQSHGYANEPVFEVTKSITIDGNWHSVTADADNWALYNNGKTGLIFSIGSQNEATYTTPCTVTMKNLTIEGHSMMKHGISVVKSSIADTTLNLENVTIKNCGANAISVNGTTVTTTDVTTSGCAWGGINVDKGGKLTVKSGDYDIVYTEDATKNTISITGGRFAVDPNEFCADGYGAVKEGNVYKVITGSFAKSEAKLDELLAAGGTVYLANNMTLAKKHNIPENTTIDCLGHTVAVNNLGAFSGKNFTIKNGIFENGSAWGFAPGSCTLENCVFNGLSPYIVPSTGIDIVVKGCTFNNTMLQICWSEGAENDPTKNTTTITGNTFNYTSTDKHNHVIALNAGNNINYSKVEVANNTFNNSGTPAFGAYYLSDSVDSRGCISINYHDNKETNVTVGYRDQVGTYQKVTEDNAIYAIYENGRKVLAKVTADYSGETFEIPSGVAAIGDYAFYPATSVKKVIVPASVTDLGRGFDSSNVEEVDLPEGLTTISSRAFRRTPNLKTLVIPSTVTTIVENAFQSSGITEITIPESVTSIEYGAFRDCMNLKTVTIKGDPTIENYAFRACPELTNVYLNGSDVKFGEEISMVFSTQENNNNNSKITIHVVNETVKERVEAIKGKGTPYNIVLNAQ